MARLLCTWSHVCAGFYLPVFPSFNILTQRRLSVSPELLQQNIGLGANEARGSPARATLARSRPQSPSKGGRLQSCSTACGPTRADGVPHDAERESIDLKRQALAAVASWPGAAEATDVRDKGARRNTRTKDLVSNRVVPALRPSRTVASRRDKS